MTDKQQEMIEYTTQDIIAFIMEDESRSMDGAMDLFYSSKTFERLTDVETGLYLQGSAYVYEMFKMEQQDFKKV
ncbi:MAG: hypothetical protein LUE92_17920 [Clostridiales bacterium]|nr:hypothetical protein [Clostridiales bacterium]